MYDSIVVGELESQHIEKFRWTIENFSKWDSKELCSEYFYVGDHPWRIAMYPKEYDTGNLSIYLCGNGPSFDDLSIFSSFKFSLINQVNARKTIRTAEFRSFEIGGSEPKYGWNALMPLAEFCNYLSGFIVNDTCIVDIEISRKQELVNYADQVVSKPAACSKEISMASDGELVDFQGFGKIEKAFVPLLEEVCLLHPSLVGCQLKKSRRFTEWAFTALGQVLHFLKTRKVKDMNVDACIHLQMLWDELQTFNFDLTWLQPHIHSALGMKNSIEKAVELRTMKENLATLKMETKSLKEKIFTAEVDLEIAKKLTEGLEERDLDAELSYGGH